MGCGASTPSADIQHNQPKVSFLDLTSFSQAVEAGNDSRALALGRLSAVTLSSSCSSSRFPLKLR